MLSAELEEVDKRGVYSVWFEGKHLVRSTNPEFATVKILRERGYTGWLHFYRRGRDHWDFRINIDTYDKAKKRIHDKE